MKTQKIILTTVFSFFAVLASAQSNSIERSISKDVQKIGNKSWLIAEHLLTVASVDYSSWIISKNVQLRSNQSSTVALGNMISTGYPLWIISKGSHKLEPTIKPKPAVSINPAIAGL